MSGGAPRQRGGHAAGGARSGSGSAALVVAVVGIVGSVTAGLVVLLAFLGTPLFAIMGGSAELLWLSHPDAAYHHLRFIAPTVLDERFADSPILVTIPLFTFVGYVLAEAKTPDRLVAAARTVLGWMPGGLAIVAVIASAVFTVLTGGSGVTIIAIGGLLYPALRKQRYSEKFALGLVTTGGSVGLLLADVAAAARLRARRARRLQRGVQGGPRAGRPRHRAAQRLLGVGRHEGEGRPRAAGALADGARRCGT